MNLLENVTWDQQGLVPTIAQDATSGEVLMLAWVNREALQHTLDSGYAHYWSRSRGKLWKKGEQSGHLQRVQEIRLDCDGDTLLFKVEQIGGIACHTGRANCFFLRYQDGAWVTVESVLKPPEVLYHAR